MNIDKIIKNLKEQNRKLKNQYELQEVRLHSLQYKVDELKEQIENQAEIIRKQSEKIIPENIDLHNRINKALEYINYMFDKANENDIIDDLLKIEKILKGSEE